MKKYILGIALAAVAVLTSCDPSKSEKDFDVNALTSDDLSAMVSFEQYSMTDSVTPQSDGNWIVFNTSPSQIITIYNYKSDGTENMLSYGKAAGSFLLRPSRGSDPNQTIYLRFVNSDGTVVESPVQLTVEVAGDLDEQVKIIASNDYGKKVWKWDTEFREDGITWGNAATMEGGAAWSGDIWWGVSPADLVDQLNHSDTGVATGEEDPDAYMEIDDEGGIKTYAADGTLIRSGSYEITNWNGGEYYENDLGYSELGKLNTDAGTILFPFQINTGGYMPTTFSIMKLTSGSLQLVYTTSEANSWGEATWWAFKSESDATGNLTDNSSKAWTWDTEFREDGITWGNAATMEGGAAWSGDIWWGVSPADLVDQLNHSDTGVATGEEDPDAYMIFDNELGTVKSYAADGTEIRSGSFEITDWANGSYYTNDLGYGELGKFNTSEGAILFPFQINTGGYMPTTFSIMKLSESQFQLVYTTSEANSWGEATWWAFKKK